ncbi:putative F-box domain, galactose oxidase/kelch, beta-propeller, F-box associated interaction [Medicago truncatula]|nr:putative F-box domain, galactose oxidase/kelch, beta-propeller, F-box associated interaction [Medicago truncatula]
MFLPHELIILILLRLPVKSLIRFKCVCKSWFSLISHDPHFANSHFQLTAATHTHRIMFRTPISEIRSVDLEASLHDDYAFMLPEPYTDLNIKASSRGFIVFNCASNIYLWNPSTGAQKQIPSPPNDYYLNFAGFGYDPSEDDYLVVSVSYDSIPNSDDKLSHLEIFTLKANVWKETVGTTHWPYCSKIVSSYYPMVDSFFNGAIHWLAFRHDIGVYVIVAFRLTERELLLIPLLDDIHDHSNDIHNHSNDRDLWVFRGSLSLWVSGDHKVDIWVMEEYGVHSSWIKTLVLSIDAFPYLYPICCTKSGNIVASNGWIGLVKYNDKGEFLEHNSYDEDARGSKMTLYTESLLSLPNDSEQA